MVEVKRMERGESGQDGLAVDPMRRGGKRPGAGRPAELSGDEKRAKRRAWSKAYYDRKKGKVAPSAGKRLPSAPLEPRKPAQAARSIGTLAETAELLENAAAALRALLG
jgi:hypothetical protein